MGVKRGAGAEEGEGKPSLHSPREGETLKGSSSKSERKSMSVSPRGRPAVAPETPSRGPAGSGSRERKEEGANPAGPQSDVKSAKKSIKMEERREEKGERSAKKDEKKGKGNSKEGAAAAAEEAATAMRVAPPLTTAGASLEAPASIALSRDGKAVLVSWLNQVEIMSPVSRKRVLSLEGHTAPVTAVSVHPINVSQAFTASFDGTIRLWDISDGANLKQWNVSQPIFQLVISPDAKYAYATILKGVAAEGNKAVSHVHQINLETSDQQRLFKCREPARLSLSRDGDMLFAVARRSLYVWVTSHSQSADSAKQNIKSIQPVQLEHARDLVSVGCHPDGNFVATGDVRGEIFLWYNIKGSVLNPESGPPVCGKSSMHWHSKGVSCLNATEDGAYLLSAGHEGVLVMWQVESGYRQFLPRLGGAVHAFTNSSCGTVVAVLCEDQVIQLVNLLTRKVSRTLRLLPVGSAAVDTAVGVRGGGGGLTASQAGAILGVEPRLGHLLINSRNASMQIWDAVKGKHVSSVQAQVRNIVLSASVSGDKKPHGTGAGPAPAVLMAAMASDGDTLVLVLGPPRSSDVSQDMTSADAARAKNGGFSGGGDVVGVGSNGNFQLSFWARSGRSKNGAIETGAGFEVVTRVMFPHGGHRVSALAYNPARPLVCTAAHDGNLKVWASKARDTLSLPPGVKASEDDGAVWSCAAVGSFRPTPCRAGRFSKISARHPICYV